MTRRARAVLAATLAVIAAAAGTAAAYVRTTDAGTGKAVFWPTPVVAYHVNTDWPAANTSPACRGDTPLSQVRRAFAEWEQDCSDLRLVYGGASSEAATGLAGSRENAVVFRRGWCSQVVPTSTDACWTDDTCPEKYDCFDDGCAWHAAGCNGWSILAQTSVLYDPGTGRIFDADMELNGWDGTPVSVGTQLPGPGVAPQHGWYFTCVDPVTVGSVVCTSYGQDGCMSIDLRNTVTHEAGHFIGLKHPCTGKTTGGQAIEAGLPFCTDALPPSAVPYDQRAMYPFSHAGDVVKRALSADDRAGVCDIYPRSGGGCGCGGGTAAGTVSLLLAALALRPRRRAGTGPGA
jgi:hypothetical protein